ncbi:hypothetical protein DFH07DRAFT_767058 [Mycena maculata]|uniref:Uncharacterized protein n=1 Tax=Mycena maculata TaxID=230809 RepID=A0AAD7NTU0_9AGAR|nr:hypothetical protein DFH07DRAFT_767058 [Mycena maculata]
MSAKISRTLKRQTSIRNTKNLADEAAAVGAAFDTVVKDTNTEILVGCAAAQLSSDFPDDPDSELALAAKWGLPPSEVAASGSGRLTRRSRSNPLNRPESSGSIVGTVDDPAANTRLSAGLAMDPGQEMPSDFRDGTNHEFILGPAEWDDGNWTLVPNKSGQGEAEGAKSGASGTSNKQHIPQFIIIPKYFPDWFDLSMDPDTLGPIPEEWLAPVSSTASPDAPTLPDWAAIDLAIFEEIMDALTDEESTLDRMAQYYSPVVNQTDSDIDGLEAQMLNLAITESMKNSRATGLGEERRAGSSKINLGAVIVEVNTDGETMPPGSPLQRPRAPPDVNPGNNAGPSKGKSVAPDEKGPEYDRLHRSGKGKKSGKAKKPEQPDKTKENHLRPDHFKRDQSEIPDGGWFRATTAGPNGPPSPPSQFGLTRI